MLLTQPLMSITPTMDGAVLQVLARAESSFTIGQLQELIGDGSYNGVRRTAERLTGQGVVRASRVGRTTVYELNRAHLAAGPIIELASLHGTFLKRLRALLNSWDIRPTYAALFGSAARGDMHQESDIDLFFVRPSGPSSADDAWQSQVDSMTQKVANWTGNDVRVLEFSHEETAVAYGHDPVLESVERDAVYLTGAMNYWKKLSRGK